MEIGKQIKKFRTEKKLSQEILAEKIYVSRQTISNWETNKNYPDVKSLLLLSSFFNVTLDILMKGDLEEMKEKINSVDMLEFKRDGNIFLFLTITLILSAAPLMLFMGFIGIGLFGLLFIVTMYYANRIDKLKKKFDIQTYKEIVAFSQGENLDAPEKNREYGKRPYQKLLIVVGFGILSFIITFIMAFILNIFFEF